MKEKDKEWVRNELEPRKGVTETFWCPECKTWITGIVVFDKYHSLVTKYRYMLRCMGCLGLFEHKTDWKECTI